MEQPTEPDEQDVKNLRDFVFESPTGGKNWEFCREHWMKADNVRWLKEQAEMIRARTVKNAYG